MDCLNFFLNSTIFIIFIIINMCKPKQAVNIRLYLLFLYNEVIKTKTTASFVSVSFIVTGTKMLYKKHALYQQLKQI